MILMPRRNHPHKLHHQCCKCVLQHVIWHHGAKRGRDTGRESTVAVLSMTMETSHAILHCIYRDSHHTQKTTAECFVVKIKARPMVSVVKKAITCEMTCLVENSHGWSKQIPIHDTNEKNIMCQRTCPPES